MSDFLIDIRAAAEKFVAAPAWDEGHGHCFHVEDPHNPIKGNPYRQGA